MSSATSSVRSSSGSEVLVVEERGPGIASLVPPLPRPVFDSSSDASDLSQRSVTNETAEPKVAQRIKEIGTWELLSPLVMMVGFSILFVILLAAAITLGIFGFVPLACAFIPFILAALGGAIEGYQRFSEDREGFLV